MSLILLALFIAISIGIGVWLQRMRAKVPQEETLKAKVPAWREGIFVHPGHAWVEVVEPDLVTLGTDSFTRSVFGAVEKLTLPEAGAVIEQGGKAWKLKRGTRQLIQTSPISGRVTEINQEISQNPQLLAQKNQERSWILKVKPIRLTKELQNLLHGDVLQRWNQSVKEQLIATLTMAKFPVLQEGGEIKPDLGDELTPQQWEQVAREFF